MNSKPRSQNSKLTMATRRQEKIAAAIKKVVSDAICNHLNDPRIEGLVSVTSVDVAADLRNANVYISIFGCNESTQNKTFMAINRAKNRIQSFVAQGVQSKFCPILHIHLDEKIKKTMETLRLIDEATAQIEQKQQNNL
jgi:ribosome-binding factor A